MRVRIGTGGWLSPEEELFVRTLVADLQFLRDEGELTALLRSRVERPGPNPAYRDNLVREFRSMLRSAAGMLRDTLKQRGAADIERQFFHLLINAQQVTSVRRVDDVNSAVDDFVSTFLGSRQAEIADSYLRLQRSVSRTGAGFFLGYAYGGMIGSPEGFAGRSDGPTIGGELYINRWTVTGELTIGRLGIRDSFAIGNKTWDVGDAVLAGGLLGAGYELRSGDALFTPFAGGTFFDLQEDNAGERRGEELTTGLQFGVAVGTLVTYRIPFDQGPHLDLRLRVSATFPGFARYASELEGALVHIGASFGFVGRPYYVEPARLPRQ